jgi:3-oxoacyl-[acyl-carrier-protein] synthase-3
MYHSKTWIRYYVPMLYQWWFNKNYWYNRRVDPGENGYWGERHIIRGEDTTTSMGVKAAEIALSDRRGQRRYWFIVLPLKSRLLFSRSGVLAQRDLGPRTIGALDARNQCSGFIYAISADQYIKTGMYKKYFGNWFWSSFYRIRYDDLAVWCFGNFGDGAGSSF